MAALDFGVSYNRIVKALWDPEPQNDDPSASPIWCLGRKYTWNFQLDHTKHPTDGQDSSSIDAAKGSLSGEAKGHCMHTEGGSSVGTKSDAQQAHGIGQSWPQDFLDDCEARPWFTYRSSFPPIQRSADASMSLSVRIRSLGEHGGFTTDTGWGCMIRSGQSLLANALIELHLGRDWRRGINENAELRLLSLFADDPRAPFSIHRFVEHGAQACGKHPGEWFGPSATARCIQTLSNSHPEAGINVYMAGDGADVYADKFLKIAESDGYFTPTLVLVGIRLGIDRITPVYWDALKDFFRTSQAVGIAGGRPSSSYYFFGMQGNSLFYLDPHYTRPALPYNFDINKYSQKEIDSCHTRRLRRLALEDMDPSMLLAYLIKSKEDWSAWQQAISKGSGTSMIHVEDSEPSLHTQGIERPGAVDDVEAFDDDSEGDGHG